MKKRSLAQFLAILILLTFVLSCEKGDLGENTPANVTPSQATAAENPETEEETEANPRARSAKLRVLEKL